MDAISMSVAAVKDSGQQISGAAKAGAGSFGDELTRAVSQLDALQTSADGEANKLAHGAGNLHETALALEKADVAMKLASKVRNKLVEAYQDVMRTSV